MYKVISIRDEMGLFRELATLSGCIRPCDECPNKEYFHKLDMKLLEEWSRVVYEDGKDTHAKGLYKIFNKHK